jgi:hypothetical protein
VSLVFALRDSRAPGEVLSAAVARPYFEDLAHRTHQQLAGEDTATRS